MRMRRLSVLLVAVLALALGGCVKRAPQSVQQQQYHDLPAVQATQPAGPPIASAPAPLVYAAPDSPAATTATAPVPRGFFTANLGGPFARAPAYASPPCGAQGCGAAPVYVEAAFEQPYLLDAGDRLRITVFGQDGLTNSYAVDAAGNVTMPLVGSIAARGRTTAQLSRALTERLKQGYIREPKVAIEVEAYRPFFIHGEVVTPGQYAFVPNMSVETAIAIAGGFGPRADRSKVTVSRTIGGQTTRASVPLSYPLRPGDTLRIDERWF
jgi:polysaccharide export outer membrane protein